MKPEDIKRIEEAAKEYAHDLTGFKAGAMYQHPIAYNQAIYDVLRLTCTSGLSPQDFIDELEKLKIRS